MIVLVGSVLLFQSDWGDAVTLVLIILVLLAAALLLFVKNQALRNKVVEAIRLTIIRAKRRFGLVSVSDMQLLAIVRIRARAKQTLEAVYLPTRAILFLNSSDVDKLDDLKDNFLKEIAARIKELDGKSAHKGDLKFLLKARPVLSITIDDGVPIGEVNVDAYIKDGTVDDQLLPNLDPGESQNAGAGEPGGSSDEPSGSVVVRIEVEDRPHEQVETRLPAEIGRGHVNVIAKDNSVSRRHARLTLGSDGNLYVISISSNPKSEVRIETIDSSPIPKDKPTLIHLAQTLYLSSSAKVVILDFKP